MNGGNDTLTRFLDALTALGVQAQVVESPAASAAAVAAICAAADARRCVRWQDPWLAELGLDAALTARGCTVTAWDESLGESTLRAAAAAADAGITGAQYAIADTGTVVLAAGPGRGRLVSLLPPLHIAVVPASAVFPSQTAFLAALTGTSLPAAVNLISGPSSSGDIENEHSIGVHGPGRVHVVLVASA